MAEHTVMPASNRHAFTSLALLLAFAGTACGSYSSPEGAAGGDDDAGPAREAEAPKAPAVAGTPDTSELNETLGVFVAPNGRPDNAGTRERPLDTIQAGIELGKRYGKRVYVCTGTFKEALVLADSISIVGGLDCGTSHWKVGGAPTRLEAPSSPAVRAKDITAPTRLEGLDIAAPHATEPSASSIGLLADHAAGLTIGAVKITAGNGADGADGVEGIQLVQQGSPAGADTVPNAECVHNQTCTLHPVLALTPWMMPPGGAGGTSICAGAPGHDGVSGGNGGDTGLFTSVGGIWHFYGDRASNAPTNGQDRSRAAAAAGTSGTPSAALGTLSAEGYAAPSGAAGTDGFPGNGGFGGRGTNPRTNARSAAVKADSTWRGEGGAGGGAGGCPGLAGTAGTGGGASVALALVDSPVVIDGAQLVSGKAGTGGRGTFGSDPTAGGAAGANTTGFAVLDARWGGTGGAAGVSTNGRSGPSIGILRFGAAPTLRGAKITAGQGGSAIDAKSHADAFGTTKTIPATPAGISQDSFAL